MPYIGTLQQGNYSFAVQTTTLVAVTFISIRRDRIAEAEIAVYSASTGATQSRSIPSNVARLVILGNAPVGQAAIIKITQGSNNFEVTAAPDAAIIMDVI